VHTEFTLFRNDPFNNAMGFLWRPLGNPERIALRIAFMFCITWGALAVLSLVSGVFLGPTLRESFLYDFAAAGQFFIAIPAFLIAEPFMDAKMRAGVVALLETGIVGTDDRTRFRRIVQSSMQARHWWLVDLTLLIFVYVSTWGWMAEEVTNASGSWHARIVGGREVITLAGWWVWFVAVPAWFFLCARFAYKILLWSVLLGRTSRIRLHLLATHPDGAGGVAFLGGVQKGFGIVIFAIGAAIACTVSYKITVEGAPTGTWATDGPWLAYILIAPLGFLAPLVMFTTQMYAAKNRDTARYRAASMFMARAFDETWINDELYRSNEGFIGNADVQAFSNMAATYKEVAGMRVVPFDLGTARRLIVSAATPMLPLLVSRYPIVKIVADLLAVGQ
jgi:hypothetical protein